MVTHCNNWIFVCVFFISGNFDYFVCSQAYYEHGSQQHQRTEIKIGGIFDGVDTTEETTLKMAVEQINRDPTILPFHHLSIKSESIPPGNSFHATKAVCNLMQEGVAGILGPQSSASVNHAQSICDRYDIPHIGTKWNYRKRQDKYAINLYPHPDTLGQAFVNLVEAVEWDNFTILYDDEESLFKLQQLIRTAVPSKRNITIRQLPEDDFRPLLKSIQREQHVKNIIVDCDIFKTLRVLRQAEQIGMNRFDYNYILTTLDLQPADMDEYKYGDAEFYAFRLVDPEKPEVKAINAELNSNIERPKLLGESQWTKYESLESPSNQIPKFELEDDEIRGITTSQALVFDAIRLFSKALDKNSELIKNIQPLNCNQNEAWDEGSTFLNDMRAMPPFQGLTGIVQFNTSGYRTDIVLDVVTVTEKGLVKVGVWENTRSLGINWIRDSSAILTTIDTESDAKPLKGLNLRVTTIINAPFCMYKLSQEPLIGNARFEGFSVDLVDDIAKILEFNYTIQLVADGTYPGMINEVYDGKSDMVVADLTVTEERQRQADFTMPFMNLGISILFVTPQAKPPSLFSFMSPFALEVWFCVAISFFGVSFVLFIVGRLAPLEWDSPLPCITEPEKLHNQFKYSNSVWFTLGSIMQQGSDVAPKAVSTRIIAAIWWFFTLIMVSSYTANLATFLIVQELEVTISSLEQFAKQTKIKYGCYKHGSTAKFFSSSNDSVKKQIWDNMVKWDQHALKATNDEGINAVRDEPGRFAFFMESTIIEYNKERKCGLEQVGGLLDNKGYGIALKKDSPYLDLFNGAVLSLQEKGKLDEFKRKWWKEQRKEQAENCPTSSVSDSVKPLRLANVGGVFVVLVVGCLCSVFITCCEIFAHSRQISIQQGESRRGEIFKDLIFALQCRGNVKQVKASRSSSIRDSREELGSTPYMNYSKN